ncbi:methyltransferase-like protein 22 [Anneissia japonica]|uniref:methyltransferase-like protein 22 n=1 Tax=Anneissia japonica TaxID=1529436 RepID=UPI0014255876|nr:methyltransferase-like protein 22 [Anneissia japonica]
MTSSGAVILSDVHVNHKHQQLDCIKPLSGYVTRFEYIIADAEVQGDHVGSDVHTDVDGDYDVKRKKIVCKDCIIIEHSLGTELKYVGLQVWQAALLLCDFILDNCNTFKGCCCLELGGGVGLASITLATLADTVFCTDVGRQILETCQNNVERNCVNEKKCKPIVRELDWFKQQHQGSEKTGDLEIAGTSNRFYWKKHELSILSRLDFIIAADVIYDNTLTEAFFNKLFEVMCGSECLKAVYIATEKRLNFTLEDLDVTCKEYDFFRACMNELASKIAKENTFKIEQIPIEFKQRFSYQRTKQLELWKIQPVKVSA